MQDRASTLGNRAIKKRCVTPPVCASGLTPRPARNHLGPTGAPGRKRFGHIGSIAGARTRTRFPAFMSEQACIVLPSPRNKEYHMGFLSALAPYARAMPDPYQFRNAWPRRFERGNIRHWQLTFSLFFRFARLNHSFWLDRLARARSLDSEKSGPGSRGIHGLLVGFWRSNSLRTLPARRPNVSGPGAV